MVFKLVAIQGKYLTLLNSRKNISPIFFFWS